MWLFIPLIAVAILCVLWIAAPTGCAIYDDETWPVISEDEFVAKCSPGTDRETALKVRRIIAEQLDVPYDRIHPDQRFVDDLDCC